MPVKKSSELLSFPKLRAIRIPEDYEQIASLLNLIEPNSTSAAALEEEDRHIPSTSSLRKDENDLLVGFGRTRIVVETEEGQIIGYGNSFRAPWVDPGTVGSTFCVHPDFRRQGVGEELLTHIENWATEKGASILTSIVMDWIEDSLPFVQKRGFKLDAHVFELELDAKHFDVTKCNELVEQVTKTGIEFVTLADLPEVESEQNLYELFVETSKDNPGQYGSIPPFEDWSKEFLPSKFSRRDWVFVAIEGKRLVGVTQLFKTEETGVVYTNYTGVRKEYRGRGIAKTLKLFAINEAINEGAHTITTDSEENNAPMQHINRSLGFLPGEGHYRIVKILENNSI